MLLLVGWVAVFWAGLTWRLAGPQLALLILVVSAAALPVTAWFWTPRARRHRTRPPTAHFVDLEQRRIVEIDGYVRERLAAGDSPAMIASSAGWFDAEGSTRVVRG